MSNYDDIFAASSALFGQTEPEQPFDVNAWAEKKQAERKSVYELADKTAQEITADGGKFRSYLDVQARFNRYSATNALLIYAQMPLATQLRDFDGWKKFGAFIKKQGKAISILEPGKEYERKDGGVGVSYDVKKVFDVSQTNARTRVQPTVQMDDRLLLQALIHNPPVPIQTVDELPNGRGALYDHAQQVIFVRRGMDAHSIFRSISLELAHAELGAGSESYDRDSAAFPAFCISYLLCRKNGIDVSNYRFDTLPEDLRAGDAQSIRAALSEIRDTAEKISTRMYRATEQTKAAKSKEQGR